MKRQFSIAICPDTETIVQVRMLKDLLRSQIGGYSSCYSEAHISFREFEASDIEISFFENRLQDFCSKQSRSEVVLNKVQFWQNGTLCLLPDEVSNNGLIGLMQAHRKFFGMGGRQSFSPHVSIARNLKNETVKSITPSWEAKEISIKMVCDNLTIRVLDPSIKQYKVYRKIHFGEH